jgi:propionyl-CoA carboxylase alpha chain
MIRKILIADRGVSALRILSTCRRQGIKSVAVYSDVDKDSPHARLADESVPLGAAEAPPAPRLLEAARRTGADAVHPGCGSVAADADFAAACETSGLTFIGPSSNHLRTGFKAKEATGSRGVSVAADRGYSEARLIEIPILGDQHGNLIHLFDRDVSLQKDGRKLFSESPATSLDSDLRARMAQAAVQLARENGYYGAATFRFLLKPGGDFSCLEGEPFLSTEHAVTEAATGLDLVQLQIEIAEGRPLPVEIPGICGHAIGASLYAGDAAGVESAPRTLHVWDPPSATHAVRIDAAVAEGVPPTDPLLAQVIAIDAARDGAIRKLSRAFEALWIGGVTTNQELLLQALKSPEFQDGKVRLGFLNDYPLQVRAEEASDIIYAAAWVLYFEGSRYAQRTLLPGVPPNYRNNPSRDPSMTLRIGSRDLAISWRRVGQNRYRIHSGKTDLDGEVLALRPGTMSVVLDGILREFRFREVGEVVYVHSSLGSQVIQRLSRYSRSETVPATEPQVITGPKKTVAPAARSPSARWPTRRRPSQSG